MIHACSPRSQDEETGLPETKAAPLPEVRVILILHTTTTTDPLASGSLGDNIII